VSDVQEQRSTPVLALCHLFTQELGTQSSEHRINRYHLFSLFLGSLGDDNALLSASDL
jgi:hypothetical protein